MRSSQRGVTLVEVLVTLVIVAFGMLGLASLQSRAQLGELESYQRAQAIMLLDDMTQRMSGNKAQLLVSPSPYVTGAGSPLGTGTPPADCTPLAAGPAKDLCEWNTALNGVAEKASVANGGTNLGAMVGARGCVEVVQAANPTPGICLPGIFRVTVAWQGNHETIAPQFACGQGAYGTDTYRRVIVGLVQAGLKNCS